MRHLLTWLLVFGIIAGLGSRVIAATEPALTHAPHEQHHECSGDHEHGHDDGPGHQHDDKCPQDHHHHCGTCVHNLPLGVDVDRSHSLALPEFSRLSVRHESERVPDGPFSALDKPPLI